MGINQKLLWPGLDVSMIYLSFLSTILVVMECIYILDKNATRHTMGGLWSFLAILCPKISQYFDQNAPKCPYGAASKRKSDEASGTTNVKNR